MENNKKQTITTPTAIVVAGFLVMLAILITGAKGGATSSKTLSEQVGVSKDKLTQCIEKTDATALQNKITISVESAMKALPADQRGTPYSIVIGKNGVKAEIRGAESVENVEKLIEDVNSGTVALPYAGEVPAIDENDHVWGNPDAVVTVIEYSDYECPYCKAYHATMKQVVEESEGTVNWVYRHWPIHQGSFAKLVAAECVSQIKGNEAFWKYTDLIFGLLKTANDPVTDNL